MNDIYRIKYLVELLNYHNNLYYNMSHPEISDMEYDKLFYELVELENKTGFILSTSPTQTVGYEVKSELQKVQHNHPMLSLAKTKDWNEFIKYFGSKDVIGMLKMDGLTCSLKYIDGELVSAETRGNGEIGEDILHNAKTITTIPKKIQYKDELIIDGEVICTLDNFKLFVTEYKNPRNFASGSIRLLDSQECAKRNLTFVVWNVIKGFDEENSFLKKLELIEEQGFTVVPWTSSFDWDAKEFLIEEARNLGYPIDGLVGRFDDIKYGKSLGSTSHHNNSAYAFKFYDEIYESTLKNIEWTIGRTGVLTPTAVFEPVEIDGTMVERASLHNISVMTEILGGAWVGRPIKVYKANMIIPQLIANPEDLTYIPGKEAKWLHIPKYCPICGGETKIKKDNDSKVLVCNNPSCAGKNLARFVHFVGRKAMNIDGLSEKTLELLISNGYIHNFKDIYHLSEHADELYSLDGLGEKSVKNLLQSIEKSRDITLDRFITAIGIPNIGSSAARTISQYFNGDHFDFTYALSNGFDFTKLNDFGSVMNESLHNWWGNKDPMVELLSLEMHFIREDNNKNTKLSGLSFCITGSLTHFSNRDALIADIESHGGKFVSSVSSKCNYLINNDCLSTSSKNKKAQSLGIPIITEELYLDLIGG